MGRKKAPKVYKLTVLYCEKTPEEAARHERETVELLSELKLRVMERQKQEDEAKRA